MLFCKRTSCPVSWTQFRISAQNCQPLTSYDESNREWFEGFNGPHSSPNAPISPVQVRLHKYIQCITILILPQSPWYSFHILLVFWADMIHSGPSASPKVLGNLAVEKGASSTFARSSKSGFGNRILGDRAGQRFRATPSKIASPCIASSGDAHTFDELQNDYSLSISLWIVVNDL